MTSNNKNFGRFLILLSAFCFYFSTVPIKLSQSLLDEEVPIEIFVFLRFFVGFCILSLLFLAKQKKPVVEDWHFVLGRAFTNFVAVWLFFKGVSLTTASEGNILNLTFPIFVSLISLRVFKAEKDYGAVGLSSLAFLGIYLVAKPETSGFRFESIWALASGVVAGVSVVYLKLARGGHGPQVILFYMFAIGSLLSGLIFYEQVAAISFSEAMIYPLAAGLLGFMGQYFVTKAFGYVSAPEGGIVATTRILIAAVLGPYVALEPALSFSGWIGALIIFAVNVRLHLRELPKTSS